MRIIKLGPRFLLAALQGRADAWISNLPEDAELLDIKYDKFSGEVVAIVRSDSFEDAAESCPVPEFKLQKSSEVTEAGASKSSKPTEPAPKPVAPSDVKTYDLRPKPAPVLSGTAGIEEEFTDDQRELLNFRVEDEFVIIKPVTFLKAEWNDINDVVKSLGGKWVKGDIISYWAVPLNPQ